MSRNPSQPADDSESKASKEGLMRDEVVAPDGPFAVFSEWASEADERAYAGWSVRSFPRRCSESEGVLNPRCSCGGGHSPSLRVSAM